MQDRITVFFENLEAKTTTELEIPTDITANDLVLALNSAWIRIISFTVIWCRRTPSLSCGATGGCRISESTTEPGLSFKEDKGRDELSV